MSQSKRACIQYDALCTLHPIYLVLDTLSNFEGEGMEGMEGMEGERRILRISQYYHHKDRKLSLQILYAALILLIGWRGAAVDQ